jgi:hypothetical protein
LDRLYKHDESKIEQEALGIKSKMELFSISPNVVPDPIPKSLDLDVLRKRIKEVRLNYSHASGRLFDICYSIQKTGELPDPEELSYVLATFLQARAMAEFLEEMRMAAQVILARPSRNP